MSPGSLFYTQFNGFKLYNTNNSILHTGKQIQVFHTDSFVWTQLNGPKYYYVSLTIFN